MSEDVDLLQLLVHEKPCDTLVSLRDMEEAYVREISTEIDSMYAHTVKIVKELESIGLLRSKKRGRKKMLELTEDGERVADAVEDFTSVIEDVGENQ